MAEKYPITTWMPTYKDIQKVLRVLEGERYSSWLSLKHAILLVIRKSENKGKFVDPERYIPELLPAVDQDLAMRLWREAHVKPHMAWDSVSFARLHQLAVFDERLISLTNAGKSFVRNDEPTIAKIDGYEGIRFILHDVAERGPGGESLFLDSFREFLHQHTTFSPEKSGFQVLRTRLINLRERGLIERRSKNYQVSDAGINYLDQWPVVVTNGSITVQNGDHYSQIIKLNGRNNADVRQRLAQHLSNMDPYQFERLIKHLLEVMEYENVEVTSGGNDKGVDVVGEKELGISRVREVIQVKRQQANVGRPVLDSLRGSLHRFDAVRGTIVTTSGFSTGAKDAAFEKGAAPITLIDGDSLLDLLVKHDIGIRKSEISIHKFDEASLRQFDTVEALDSDLMEQPESE